MGEGLVVHRCYCRYCAPDRFPSGPRLSSGHFGERVGVTDPGPGKRWRVTLDGVDVTRSCVEALDGSDGWVQLYSEGRHPCVCGEGICEWVVVGSVVVRLVLDPATALLVDAVSRLEGLAERRYGERAALLPPDTETGRSV